ncbi:MAG: NCS2 family permease [Chloroflexota bacterium]|nr:NCS2 family permease [Chloroflexota bacterium]
MQGVGRGAIGARPGTGGGGALERLFRLREHGTNARTELLAGLTTFVVMSYIIAVNPGILSAAGLDVRATATSTCLVAGVLSIAMGLYSNRAFALAPGLGLNAIVAFTLVGQLGLTPAEAMGVVVLEGLIITALVLLGVRRYVLDIVPRALNQAISVGIGFFILFIGLTNAGLITFIPGENGTSDGLLALTPLNTWPIFVVMLGLLTTIVLIARGVRAGILIGIAVATLAAFLVPGEVATFPDRPLAGPDFGLVGEFSFGFFAKLGVLSALLAVFSFGLADFFDTMGSLIGVGAQAGYLDENGDLPGAQRPLLVDSLAAAVGGAASASSATTYIESAAGVSVGGRTGLVAVTTGALFLLALPFVGLVTAVPTVATAPALIVVGFLMVGVLSERTRRTETGEVVRESAIDFGNIEEGLPVVLMMLLMPLTFNITNGIGAGFVSYVLIKLARGKAGEVHPALWVVAGAFLLYFLRWALFGADF